MARGDVRVYTELARRGFSTEVVGVAVTDTELLGHSVINAEVAWNTFHAASKCPVCSNATSQVLLRNFGGVCKRCHNQHRYPHPQDSMSGLPFSCVRCVKVAEVGRS